MNRQFCAHCAKSEDQHDQNLLEREASASSRKIFRQRQLTSDTPATAPVKFVSLYSSTKSGVTYLRRTGI